MNEVINLDDINTEWEIPYLNKKYEDKDMSTVGDLKLKITLGGHAIPDNFNVLITKDFYILRLVPEEWDDGFNIYKIKRVSNDKK